MTASSASRSRVRPWGQRAGGDACGAGWRQVPKGPGSEPLGYWPETPPHTHPPAPGTGNKAGGAARRGGALGWPDPRGSSLGGSAGLPHRDTCPSSEARSPLQPSTGVAARTPGRFLAGSCGRLPPSSLPSAVEGHHHWCSGPTRPRYPSCSLSQTPPSDVRGGSQGHRASPTTQAACLLWMMTAGSSAGVTLGTTAADLAGAVVCRAGPGGRDFWWVWPGREQGLRRASGPVHSYREVDSGGHPVKVIPERLEAVDVRGEVLRPGLGEDSPGCPQHPVGLEGLLQVLGQAAAVVDDGTELLHLWASGSAAGAGGPVWGWVDPPSRAKAARQAHTPTGQPVCSSIMESTCTGELQVGSPVGPCSSYTL